MEPAESCSNISNTVKTIFCGNKIENDRQIIHKPSQNEAHFPFSSINKKLLVKNEKLDFQITLQLYMPL